MPDRDRRQPRELWPAVDRVLALADAPRGRAAERFVGCIDLGQQLHVAARVAAGEAAAPIDGGLDCPRGHVTGDQPRSLRPAQAGHLLDVAPHQAALGLAQGCVLVLDQNSLDPGVTLGPAAALKMDILAGQKKTANRLQTQMLGLVHADVQSPA